MTVTGPMFRMHWLRVAAAATLCAAPLAAQDDDFRWRGRIASGDAIEIKGVNGDVVAERASGGEVEVTAVKRGRRSDPDEVEIEVVEHAGGVTICAVYPSRRGRLNECREGRGGRMETRRNDVRVHFTVRVPPGVRFIGRTVNGDVEARGLESDAQVRTVNGDVDVETTGLAEGSTVNGSVWVAIGGRLEHGLEFATVNGSITIVLPEEIHADLRASTVNGGIDTEFPISITGRMNRRRVQGEIGDGGPMLEVSTVNGSIRLRRR